MLRDVRYDPAALADPGSGAPALAYADAEARFAQVLAQQGEELGVDLARMAARRQATGEEPLVVDLDHDRWSRFAWIPLARSSRAAAVAAGASLATRVGGDAVLQVGDAVADLVPAIVHGWELAGYAITYSSKPPPPRGSLTVCRPAPDDAEAAFEAALVRAAATARDLANAPSDIKSPQWLADEAQRGASAAGLSFQLLAADELRQRGFGGLLAVGSGSSRPPALGIIKRPGAPGGPTIVLVGKGITFDSGGLSLKPVDSMPLMKTDMSGAAAVIGALTAIGDMSGRNDAATIVGLLPMAENMPGAAAYRPGDVVRHFGGATTEVSNTDAEGRLVLADALAFARATQAPDVIVDVATLTGAATLGLSRLMGALYSDDDRLAASLVEAGEAAGDPVWRMPLVPEYRSALESRLADIAQASTDPTVRAGSITAALYLQHFVGDVPWAHLDIAGPARADKPRREVTAGATGFGARLLTAWLLRHAVPRRTAGGAA